MSSVTLNEFFGGDGVAPFRVVRDGYSMGVWFDLEGGSVRGR